MCPQMDGLAKEAVYEQYDPLEKGMTPHSSSLAWRIPQTGKPGGLQSTETERVGHG